LHVALSDIVKAGVDGFHDALRRLSLAHSNQRNGSWISSGAPQFPGDLTLQRRESLAN
jgi:hypothetical protein